MVTVMVDQLSNIPAGNSDLPPFHFNTLAAGQGKQGIQSTPSNRGTKLTSPSVRFSKPLILRSNLISS